jgi:hypothetical protein
METETVSENFDFGKLIVGCSFKALRETRREGEGTAIRQIDDYLAKLPIISRCRGTGLRSSCRPSPLDSGVDLRIRQFTHGFPSIEPETTSDVR